MVTGAASSNASTVREKRLLRSRRRGGSFDEVNGDFDPAVQFARRIAEVHRMQIAASHRRDVLQETTRLFLRYLRWRGIRSRSGRKLLVHQRRLQEVAHLESPEAREKPVVAPNWKIPERRTGVSRRRVGMSFDLHARSSHSSAIEYSPRSASATNRIRSCMGWRLGGSTSGGKGDVPQAQGCRSV